VFIFFKEQNLNSLHYLIYQTITWAIISYFTKFYAVYRFTTPVEIISKIFKQGMLFLLVIIAFFPFSKQVLFSGKAIAYFMVSSFTLITIFKFLLFYYLKNIELLQEVILERQLLLVIPLNR